MTKPTETSTTISSPHYCYRTFITIVCVYAYKEDSFSYTITIIGIIIICILRQQPN
jgi:hypothetical protein